MKAVILAGGKGTRMGNLTQDFPKSMLQIGDKPVLLHQITLLKKYGIKDIIILINYLGAHITDYFGNGSALDVNIDYYEEQQPLGTVGGIKEIESKLREDFIVLYGDVMINMHLGRFIDFHRNKNSECTLVLHPNDHPFDSDLVETDTSDRVIKFFPKPHQKDKYYPNLVNAGAYIFSPSIFGFIEKGKKADFGREVFPAIYDKIKIFGYNTAEYLKDMGTPERLQEVNRDWESKKIIRASYEHKQKAIFLDRDGVLNEEISFISKPEDMILYPFTPDAVRQINNSDYKAIVVTNQSVIARNLCTFEELKNIHNKMETELGAHKAKIDALYFCPHHPDGGYPEERPEFKIDCECRKPKPGMFLEAADKFNLDLSESYIIGDNERDIRAGINVSCTTVGVMTGYGLRKTSVFPDFFFTDLAEAVSFIVGEPYKHIYEEIKSPKKKIPGIIAIGGNARSGKSTLASYIRMKLEKEGRKVLMIELDRWILPEEEREPGMDVYDRFRLQKIESDIQQILAGIPVKTGKYTNHPERKPNSFYYKYSGQDFIIIEGVVALSSEVIRSLAHRKFFVSIDPETHRKRFDIYYKWKGKNEEETDRLYRQRVNNEYSLIEKESKFADSIINP